MSPELRLMLAPRAEYHALANRAEDSGWFVWVRRPALVALIIGTGVAAAATEHVTPRLLASTTLCWSVVPVLQILIAAPLLLASPLWRFRVATRLDLWFASHGPWSLWLLLCAAIVAAAGKTPWLEIGLLASATVPALWTARLVAAFCREVMQMTEREARRRAVRHQLIVLAVILGYVFVAGQGGPRVVGWIW